MLGQVELGDRLYITSTNNSNMLICDTIGSSGNHNFNAGLNVRGGDIYNNSVRLQPSSTYREAIIRNGSVEFNDLSNNVPTNDYKFTVVKMKKQS